MTPDLVLSKAFCKADAGMVIPISSTLKGLRTSNLSRMASVIAPLWPTLYFSSTLRRNPTLSVASATPLKLPSVSLIRREIGMTHSPDERLTRGAPIRTRSLRLPLWN